MALEDVMDVLIGKELELKFLIPIRSQTFTNMILSMLLTARVYRQKKCKVSVMNGLRRMGNQNRGVLLLADRMNVNWISIL